MAERLARFAKISLEELGKELFSSGVSDGKSAEELFKTELLARDFNWLIEPPEGMYLEASVRVRHTKWEEPPCRVTAEGGTARISCQSPVRAPAPGQSAVLYQGERLLGGGFITE